MRNKQESDATELVVARTGLGWTHPMNPRSVKMLFQRKRNTGLGQSMLTVLTLDNPHWQTVVTLQSHCCDMVPGTQQPGTMCPGGLGQILP